MNILSHTRTGIVSSDVDMPTALEENFYLVANSKAPEIDW